MNVDKIFSSPIMKSAQEILKTIENKGYSAYIVGGCVRDIFLNVEPHDVDIATNCPIALLEELFNVSADIGKNKQFGIIIIENNGFKYEVAQFRTETYLKPKYVEKLK